MEVTMYTKGEWEIQDRTHIFSGERLVANCGGYSVSTMESSTLKENIANAHLISAAPDMYEALKRIRLQYSITNHELDKALAKAEGIKGGDIK